MSRLIATLQLDITIQWRNRLYLIGLALALIFGVALRLLFPPGQLPITVPVAFLLIGGAGMLYIVALLIFEQDERTLDAQLVAPLRLDEYLAAKLGSLTLLALAEGALIALPAAGLAGYNPALLLLGAALQALILTLMGLLVAVRYTSLSDALIPMAVIGVVMQLPLIFFTGVSDAPWWLLVPTSAPVLLIRGAFVPLEAWQLLYGLGYSALLCAGLYAWARRDFLSQIVRKVG